MGPGLDHVKLSTDMTALLDFFVDQSGLPREAFGDVVWVTDYRQVISGLRWVLRLLHCGPLQGQTSGWWISLGRVACLLWEVRNLMVPSNFP